MIDEWYYTQNNVTLNDIGEKMVDLKKAIEREKAKPVRNCDKYRTAEDAHAGFIEFCRKYTCGQCRFVNNGTPVGYAIEWLYGDASKEAK